MKNKKILIICMFLLIILLFTNNVFASSSIKCQSCDSTLSTILDYDFSVIKENGGKHLGLITSVNYNDEKYVIAYWSYDSNYHNVKPYIKDGVVFMEGTYNTMIYKVVDNSLVHQGWSGGLFEKNGFDDLGKNSTVYSSTSDIYKDSSCSDVFFQEPPAKETLTLEEITEMAQTEIIPTILIVIAVVVGLVILLIGLKKGFKILVNGLKI